MSVYKEIKNIGVDLFYSYHPKVLQLKREAKSLYKNLKSQGLSLMQCQELVAKRNGFTNWYSFIHLIKKHYQQDLENIPFIITTDKITPKKDNKYSDSLKSTSTYLKDEKNKPILFGYDINFGHYKWQNDSSMRTHQLILGQSIYNKYDVYIAKQSIRNNRSVIFFNGDGDAKTLDSLIQSAKQANRLSDIKIINFTKESLYLHHEYKIKDIFLGSIHSGVELFYKFLDFKEDYWNMHGISLISFIIMYLVYKRDNEGMVITLDTIKEHFNLEKIKTIVQEDLPQHIKHGITNYLNSSESSHEYIVKNLIKFLDELIATEMFTNDENAINLNNLIDKNKNNIYIFQISPDTKISKFLLLILKENIDQFYNISGLNEEKKNSELFYIFIRSCNILPRASIMLAHARAMGLSLTLSYLNIKKLEYYSDKENTQAIIANCNTKIFSNIEEDEQTVKLLNMSKDEVSQSSILNINNENISISIKSSDKKSNYVWLIKSKYASQISFESPDEDNMA
jgi:hypothetical protein